MATQKGLELWRDFNEVFKVLRVERARIVNVPGNSPLHEASVDVQEVGVRVGDIDDRHHPAVGVVRRVIDVKNYAGGSVEDAVQLVSRCLVSFLPGFRSVDVCQSNLETLPLLEPVDGVNPDRVAVHHAVNTGDGVQLERPRNSTRLKAVNEKG